MARGLATANRGTAATAGAIVAPRQLLPLLLAAAVAALALLPAPAAAAAKCGKLSLLAVGDSITKGSIPSQQRNTPYADTTRDALSAMLGGCFDVQTTTAALGGSGIFVRNGQTLPEFARPALAAQKWDWVLVMAGINDLLLGGKSAKEIWDGGLRALYDDALGRGAHVLAMVPLPNNLVRSDDPKDRERRALADLIYSYSLARPAVHPFFWGVQWSGDQKARWLDGDRLHLTPAGHQELGRQVALAVRREMGAAPCGAGCAKFAPAAPAPPPRFAPDPSAEPQLPAEPRGGGGFGISMGGMNLLDPMGIISGSASAVGSFIPLPNLGALGAVLPGFRGFGVGLPSLSMAARAARGQQCGGAGLACVAFSYFCVDAPFPNVACGQGACTRLSEWNWVCA